MIEPSSKRIVRRRRLKKIALGLFVVALGTGAIMLVQAWVPLGKAASGARLERMQSSAQWDDDGFENPEPLWNDAWGMFTGALSASPQSSPDQALEFDAGDTTRFEQPPATGLRATWLGHSTILVEIDGHRVLTDPVWGERTSPISWLGPKRFYPPPIPLEELPAIDVVLISHDHYDHLDQPTIDTIKHWDTTFVVPLGVGAHLEYWGVPQDHIIELDWWERTRVGTLDIVCTPARHASGRHLFDQSATLWAGYALHGAEHRVFFSGDTGLFNGMTTIGDELGPFDLTMIETGAYDQAWPDWHIGPEQAVRAHQMLRGEVMLPIHWGLFDLAYHSWTEPLERTLVAGAEAGVVVAAPQPGQSFEPEALEPVVQWWPAVLWRRANEYPIVSTAVD